VVGAVIGAMIVPRYFDTFIVVASAFGGAALVMAGAHLLFPGVELFDRSAGGVLPGVVTLILMAVGIAWQFKVVAAWVRQTASSAPSTRDRRGP